MQAQEKGEPMQDEKSSATSGPGKNVMNAASTEGSQKPAPATPPTKPLTPLDHYRNGRFAIGERATLDDLWYCYRLILRRRPDDAGFSLYSKRVEAGMSVADLTKFFLHSKEFQNRSQRIAVVQSISEAPTETQLAPLRINGIDLYMPVPETQTDHRLQASGHYKPHLKGVISSILSENQFVLDIGAGIGAFAIAAAKKVGPGGRVVALEPATELMRLLLANTALHDLFNIDALPFAAADGEGFVQLVKRDSILTARDPSHSDVTSLLEPRIVYARMIDSIIPAKQKVDLIRVALDGFDYRAMRGAETLLKTCCPPIVGEYAPSLLKEFSGIAPESYLSFLRECGYSHFVAIPEKQGALDVGGDVGKLANIASSIGTGTIDFCATKD